MDAIDGNWETWMAGAQAGDGASYARLLAAAVPFLRRVALRAGVPDSAADDVVQNTLIGVHAARHTYDPARPLKPWLAAIARRRAIDWRRRGSAAMRHEVAFDDQALAAFGSDETIQAVARRDEARELRRCVETLPARQRTAIELLKFREMDLKAASAESGLSVGALKIATHRAVARLRALMNSEAREIAA
jgi:RNA polymerase sigma-70 factor, ECF subfamily